MQDNIDLIVKYFPGLSDNQKQQFKSLHYLCLSWNEKVNLISRKDIDFLQERHVLHSLAIAKFFDFQSDTKIMDAGTGGGFPGIPLSILFPEADFLLVDSIGKKIIAVKDLVHNLGLKNVRVKQERIEKISDKFDYIVSRAVTRLKLFYMWTKDKIRDKAEYQNYNGIIYLKGGDLSSEIEELQQQVKVYNINTYFRETFFESKKIVFIPKLK